MRNRVTLFVFFSIVCQFTLAQGGSTSGSIQSAETFSGKFSSVNQWAHLTVSGSGYWHRDSYSDGEIPVIVPFDQTGQTLPDGSYTYEFRTASDDFTQTRSDYVTGGGFEINAGVVSFH